MTNLLTKKDIANRIKIASSNVSYYIDNYGEFLPSHKLDGIRHPKYEAEAVEIIKKIKKLYEAGKSRDEIKQELSKTYTPIIDGDNNQEAPTRKEQQQNHNLVTTTTLQQSSILVTHHIGLTQSALESLNHYRELLKTKDEEITTLQQKVGDLERENQDLKDTNETLESDNMRQKEELKRIKKGFWKRLVG